MSLARNAARVIRQQLRAHVAWLPLGNNFDLGDFGVFSGGVFVRLGNIAVHPLREPLRPAGPPAQRGPAPSAALKLMLVPLLAVTIQVVLSELTVPEPDTMLGCP